MFLPLSPSFQSSSVYGTLPVVWVGSAAVVAGSGNWRRAPISSVYHRKVANGHYQRCTKVKNDGTATDWLIEGTIREDFVLTDFTDGGSTSGAYTLTQVVPDKSFVERCVLYNLDSGGAGVTTLVIVVGDGDGTTPAGSVVDKYMTGTPSIATDADVVDLGVPSAPAVGAVAGGIRIAVTEGSDFGDVTTLTGTLELRYRSIGT